MKLTLDYDQETQEVKIEPAIQPSMAWEIRYNGKLYSLYEYPEYGGERYLVSTHKELLEVLLEARKLT